MCISFQFDEMYNELEEFKEISTNRLSELEKLTSEHQEALKEMEKLKMDVSIFNTNKIMTMISFTSSLN